MNLNSLGSGLGKNADKLGYIAALLTPTEGGSTGIQVALQSLNQALAGIIHMPDVTQLESWAQYQGVPAFMAYLGGMVLEDFNLPIVGKFGKPLQKGAVAFALGTGALRVAYAMTHSPLAKGSRDLFPDKTTQQNFSNAPAVTQLNPYRY